MYSQNDETGNLYRMGSHTKFSLWILQCSGDISVNFLKIKRVTNLYISLSTIIRYYQNLQQEIGECKKAMHFHQLWGIRSTCGIKVGCPFWTCEMLPLDSKIGPEELGFGAN